MSLALKQSDDFWADLHRHVDWYREKAAPDIAERFVDTVEAALESLTRTPGLGRPRFVNGRSWRGFARSASSSLSIGF